MSFSVNNWPEDRWPNFAHRELACSETGECEMDEAFMDRLQLLRNHYGHALRIASGYRSPAHSIEAAKSSGPGTPCEGPRRRHRLCGRRRLRDPDRGAGMWVYGDRGEAIGRASIFAFG